MSYAIYRMTAIYNPTTGIIAKVTFEIEIRKMMEEINNSSLFCFVSKPSPLGLCSTERLTRPRGFLRRWDAVWLMAAGRAVTSQCQFGTGPGPEKTGPSRDPLSSCS